MVSFFLVCLPDRYDHHTRLLPYLLSFFNDNCSKVRRLAIDAIEKCGEHYEVEHADDIIERRQYGVDGDLCNNLSFPLPEPFENRPRLGARLFVRSNTKRFFKALTKELSSWSSSAREKAAQLVKLIVIFNEEHLTIDFHQTLSDITKAIANVWRDDDNSPSTSMFIDNLMELLSLMGRYVQPLTYVPLLIPRIIGNGKEGPSFSEGGHHSEVSRAACTMALRSLIEGSRGHLLLPHVQNLIDMFVSNDCIGQNVGARVKIETMKTIEVFLGQVCSLNSRVTTSAYIEETGRLIDVKGQLLSLEQTLIVNAEFDTTEISSIVGRIIGTLHDYKKKSFVASCVSGCQ